MSERDHTTKPAREKVDELLDDLEDMGWVATKYKGDLAPFDPLWVKLELEYRGDWNGTDE